MRRKLTALLLALCMVLCLASGCDTAGNIDDDQPKAEDVTVRVGAMNGPTAMGMVKLMDDAENGKTSNEYEFSLETGADVFAPALAKGELDIAAVPANLASILYNNTDGGVKVIAVNTLGVLYVVERGDTVKSVQDLKGKTIYATGEGAAPEFGLRYILKENGIDADNDLSIRWCADTTEALSLIAADESAVAMLPQPFVTAAQSKVPGLRIALDLNEEWEALGNGSAMVTGVLVVRSEFAQQHPEQLDRFLEEYKASVEYVTENNEDAAALIGGYEIVAEPIALMALPYCNITCLTAKGMKSALEGYLKVLYDMKPAAVGGELPGADFYYGA